MKINDKNLCAYSVSKDNIDKEGYLFFLKKRSESSKAFQRKWFVLKGNLLFYFERRGDREPAGLIIMEGCALELAEYDNMYSFKIVFSCPSSKTYVLAAESQESLESWMKSLAVASFDWLKHINAELQKQLEDLESTLGTDFVSEQCSGDRPKRINPFDREKSLADAARESQTSLRGRSNTVTGNMAVARLPASAMVPTRAAPEPPVCVRINSPAKTIWYKTFIQLHEEYGVRILKDRERFLSETQLLVMCEESNDHLQCAELCESEALKPDNLRELSRDMSPLIESNPYKLLDNDPAIFLEDASNEVLISRLIEL